MFLNIHELLRLKVIILASQNLINLQKGLKVFGSNIPEILRQFYIFLNENVGKVSNILNVYSLNIILVDYH